MTDRVDGILLSSNLAQYGGRNLALFRLRTSAEENGFSVKVIDNSAAMTTEELILLLEILVTKDTLFLGFSLSWINGYGKNYSIDWLNDVFFYKIRRKFPWIKIISGGPDGNWVIHSSTIFKNSDWVLSGFSDIGFVTLLGDLKYGTKTLKFTFESGKKVVYCNTHYPIVSPDSILTKFIESDNFKKYQPLPLELSRGCIFRCSFCNHPFQGAKDYNEYMRTPENIANELKRNYELFGTTRYNIMDDTFNDSLEKLDRLSRAIDLSKIPDFKFQSYIKPELLSTKPEMIDRLKDLGLSGGFVGIESFNNLSRKIIKKGMDIDRVLDAIYKLVDSTDARISASFIVGLPEETIDEIYRTQEYLILNKDRLFKSWGFQPLGIFYNRQLKGLSEIDRSPEKFGYTIVEKNKDSFAKWYNNKMSSDEAIIIANELNTDLQKINRPAGWHLSMSWHLGISDNLMDNTLDNLNLSSKGVVSNRHNAIRVLAEYGIDYDKLYLRDV